MKKMFSVPTQKASEDSMMDHCNLHFPSPLVGCFLSLLLTDHYNVFCHLYKVAMLFFSYCLLLIVYAVQILTL